MMDIGFNVFFKITHSCALVVHDHDGNETLAMCRNVSERY